MGVEVHPGHHRIGPGSFEVQSLGGGVQRESGGQLRTLTLRPGKDIVYIIDVLDDRAQVVPGQKSATESSIEGQCSRVGSGVSDATT